MNFKAGMSTLSEISSDIAYGYTASAKTEKVGPKFLRITDIQGGLVNWDDVPYCEIDEEKVEKYLLKIGDIVIARTGNSTGENYVFQGKEEVIFASYLIRYRINPSTANPFFIAYQLRSDRWWSFIESIKGGSAQAGANAKVLGSFECYLPDLDEQDRVVDNLKSIDRKIELNRQINQTLEQIAQAIFKSWFFDFDPVKAKIEAKENGEDSERAAMCAISGKSDAELDQLSPEQLEQLSAIAALFPDELEESELSKIPKGWEIVSIGYLSSQVAMGPFGSNIKVSTFVTNGIPVISGKHLNGALLEDHDYNYITEEHANKLLNSNVYRGDVVFTHAGNIGQVAYIPDKSKYERYVLSQRQFYMRPDRKKISPLFILYYFKSDVGQHNLLANTSQVGVPSISRPVSYLKTIKLVIPNKKLSDIFDRIIRSLHTEVSNNVDESATLDSIRDVLLPKLVQGEL